LTSPTTRAEKSGTSAQAAEGELRFWRLAEPLLAMPGVTRSTMMGLPCLRIDGSFFASCDRRTGALLVKLPEAKIDKLISAGRAEPFSPAGHRFRQWAAIPADKPRSWRLLLDEALHYVSELDAHPST
jgi:hypothetical protein